MTAPALIRRFVVAFLALSGFGFWGLMVEAVVSAGVVPWRMVVLIAAACIAALIWDRPRHHPHPGGEAVMADDRWHYFTPDGPQPYHDGWNMTRRWPTMEPPLEEGEVNDPRFVGSFVEGQKWVLYGPDPDPRYGGHKRPLRTEWRYWPPSTRDQAAERPVAVTTIEGRR